MELAAFSSKVAVVGSSEIVLEFSVSVYRFPRRSS